MYVWLSGHSSVPAQKERESEKVRDGRGSRERWKMEFLDTDAGLDTSDIIRNLGGVNDAQYSNRSKEARNR